MDFEGGPTFQIPPAQCVPVIRYSTPFTLKVPSLNDKFYGFPVVNEVLARSRILRKGQYLRFGSAQFDLPIGIVVRRLSRQLDIESFLSPGFIEI